MEFVGHRDELFRYVRAISALEAPSTFEGQQVFADFVAYLTCLGGRVSHVHQLDSTFPPAELCDRAIQSPKGVWRSVESDDAEERRRGRAVRRSRRLVGFPVGRKHLGLSFW